MIVRITQTIYSDYDGIRHLEPTLYKMPRDLQKMIDDVHSMRKDSDIKAEVVSAELTDSDNFMCNNPYNKEKQDE